MKFKLFSQLTPALLLPALVLTAPGVLVPTSGVAAERDELVVSARRRDESAQDIPVAVAAFGSDFIEKQGVVSTKDIVKLVPGVQFD